MKKTFNPIEEFHGIKFNPLTKAESDDAWNAISTRIETPNAFPFVGLLKINRKPMIPLLIGALLFASAGGTVAASNNAVPGDVLFGVDRAVENVRLALAGDASTELKLKFAEERLGEVQTLIARARAQANVSATTTATTTASTSTSTVATSTPKQKSNDSVALGVNVALAYLNSISDDLSASGNAEVVAKLENVIGRLETITNSDDVKAKLKNNGEFQLRLRESSATSTASTTGNVMINTNGNKTRIEIREDGERFRIEIKDLPAQTGNGDLEMKLKTNDDEDDNEEENDDVEDEDEDDREDEDRENDDEDKDNSGRGRGRLDSSLRIDLR